MKYANRNREDELLGKTIAFLRFPLSVAVVLLHSSVIDSLVGGGYNGYLFVSGFFYIITQIAVPSFFFFSGFLFFHKMNGFTFCVYTQKLKKRIDTLVIPYVFWNLFVAVLYLMIQTIIPGMMSGKNKLLVDYSISDWLWMFWDTNRISPAFTAHLPLNGPLWFVRDLIVVVIGTPLVYFLIRRLHICIVIFLGLLWIGDLWVDITGFSSMCLFFFSAGAYFGIKRLSFLMVKRLDVVCLIFYLYIASVFVESLFQGKPWISYLHNVGVLLGMFSLFNICAYFINKRKLNVNLFPAGSSFFIYAFHIMPLLFMIKLLIRLIQPHSNIELIVLYFVCPLTVVYIGLEFYKLLNKYFPYFMAIITGGR